MSIGHIDAIRRRAWCGVPFVAVGLVAIGLLAVECETSPPGMDAPKAASTAPT